MNSDAKIGENSATRDITMPIEESLQCQSKCYKDEILFYNGVIKDQVNNLGDQRLYYNIKKWKNRSVLTFFVTSVKILLWYRLWRVLLMSIIK